MVFFCTRFLRKSSCQHCVNKTPDGWLTPYTEADVKKIAAALTREIDALKARMLQSGVKDSVDFTL